MTEANRNATQAGGTYGSTDAAERWQRSILSRTDLGPITQRMLDLARIATGHRVLDVAAGTGEQSLMAARIVGPQGFVLAADIADRLLAYLAKAANDGGITNVQTLVMDARDTRRSHTFVIELVRSPTASNSGWQREVQHRDCRLGSSDARLIHTDEDNPGRRLIMAGEVIAAGLWRRAAK